MSDKAAALKEKLANLKRKRQEAKTANHRDVCRNQRRITLQSITNMISGCGRR